MADELRSADMLVKDVLSDPAKVEALKTNPAATLQTAAVVAKASTPLDDDPWVYRIVVASLGLTSLAVVIGCIVIAVGVAAGKDLPSGLVALGSAAVGALAGLLAPPPNRR